MRNKSYRAEFISASYGISHPNFVKLRWARQVWSNSFRIRDDRRGFTLIELLVVISLIGVLAAVLISVIDPLNQIRKARDSRRKSDLANIQKLLEVYYHDNGSYPINRPSCNFEILGDNGDGNTCVEWGTSWPGYTTALPRDPQDMRQYAYYSTGQSYYLYASLERGSNDSQVCTGGGVDNACPSLSTNNIISTACGGVCNYAVTSPNVNR